MASTFGPAHRPAVFRIHASHEQEATTPAALGRSSALSSYYVVLLYGKYNMGLQRFYHACFVCQSGDYDWQWVLFLLRCHASWGGAVVCLTIASRLHNQYHPPPYQPTNKPTRILQFPHRFCNRHFCNPALQPFLQLQPPSGPATAGYTRSRGTAAFSTRSRGRLLPHRSSHA